LAEILGSTKIRCTGGASSAKDSETETSCEIAVFYHLFFKNMVCVISPSEPSFGPQVSDMIN